MMTRRPPEHDTHAEPEATRAAVLSERFGVPVWWGKFTRRYWAIIPGGRWGRLIEAADPHELAGVISWAHRRSLQRGMPVRPPLRPAGRRPDLR